MALPAAGNGAGSWRLECEAAVVRYRTAVFMRVDLNTVFYTSFWITENLKEKQEDAFMKLFEGSAVFTNAEFVRWLEDLGLGKFLD